jgi:uncharacterized protein (DUF1330 family)
MDTTRRTVLMTGGLLSGAIGLGGATDLFALEGMEDQPDQPGDEVGTATRNQRIGDLIDRLGEDPVDMMNLLKLKPGGEASYGRYGQGFGKILAKYAPATTVAYSGDCASLLIGDREWDRLIIVRYPSMKAFSEVIGSPEYAEIAHLRTDALERTMVYAVVPSQR